MKNFTKSFKSLMREPAVSLARWMMAVGVILLVYRHALPEPRDPYVVLTGTSPSGFLHTAGLGLLIMSLALNALGCFLYWLEQSPSTRATRFFKRLAWWKPIRTVMDAPLVYFLVLCALAVATGLVFWFSSGVEFLNWIETPSFWLAFWGIMAAVVGFALHTFYEAY
ncbi:MAG TPA: hypothetical protein VFO38_01440 [Candidatus Saccharimonadales bacterium]|nr:hypothetical protein [Candidatus Saccharimonadales bacterium]